MKRIPLLFLLMLMLPAAAHARTEPVRAVEGDIAIPYTKMGTLEVKRKAAGVGDLPGKTLQVLTLGAYRPSQGDRRRKVLREMLITKASKHYGADAVINVHYWPDPDSEAFPQGTVYARGEMVRYTHFPSNS